MAEVPESPHEFFTSYLPSKFEAMKAKMAGKSSVGSMAFRVPGGGEWSIRLTDGAISVSEGLNDDVIVQVTVPSEDFVAVMVEGARAQDGTDLGPEAQVMAMKALTVDGARAATIRDVKGNIAFVITDGDRKRKLVITPGNKTVNVETPECRLECQMSDFLQLQTGKALPIQLAMSGKIRIVGDASLPMALNAVLA